MTRPLADLTQVFTRGGTEVVVTAHHSRCAGYSTLFKVGRFRAILRRLFGPRKLLLQTFNLLLELILQTHVSIG